MLTKLLRLILLAQNLVKEYSQGHTVDELKLYYFDILFKWSLGYAGPSD